MLKEFKEFALRGNVVDMAVGIIIGAAFGTIVRSLVDDMIMPPIGLLIGNMDFSELFILIKPVLDFSPDYNTIDEAKEAGAVTMNYGRFINNIISFIIVAFAIFMLIKGLNNLKRKQEAIPAQEPVTKDCPYCLSSISIKASKCSFCTSELSIEPPAAVDI
jgi:large conductance mechanosensitive channel